MFEEKADKTAKVRLSDKFMRDYIYFCRNSSLFQYNTIRSNCSFIL